MFNKHSESIAEAIQVPYRPQQIFKRHNSYNSRSKGPKKGTLSVLCRYKFIQKNSSHWNMTEKSLGNVRKTKFMQRALTPVKLGQAWRNTNLICIQSKAIHILNFNWISQKTAEKMQQKKFEQRAITPVKICQVRQNLICIKSKPINYTKFQFNISKDCKEKSGKLNFC